MCEIVVILVSGVWEIVRTALGIGLGTALAWYCVIGPILRQNERRKKEEDIIEKTIEWVYRIQCMVTAIAEDRSRDRKALSGLNADVHKFTDHVRLRIRSSIPGLAEKLQMPVNRLISGTCPPHEIEEEDAADVGAAIFSYVDRLISEVPATCQLLLTTLEDHKRDAVQSDFNKTISYYYRELKSTPAWQNRAGRLR